MTHHNLGEISIFEDVAAVAKEAASLFISLSREAILSKGRFTVALAGGSTPKALYELLAGPLRGEIEWEKVFVFWGDERFVPPDHADSSYAMINASLLTNVPLPQKNIFQVPTVGLSIEESAAIYSATLVTHVSNGNELPCFDLVLLGMGSDGHTASLFPGSPTLYSQDLVAVEKHSPKPPLLRVTFTHKLINNASNILIMVTGADKSQTLRNVLEGERGIDRLPIQGVCPTHGKLFWFVDKKAAGQVS